ncbi:MAG: RNA-binding S4 domain-containing protein [Tissierellia bacterium]|nr:RNA-binding S4 domain-containing protein [Tissierellia bacterium]
MIVSIQGDHIRLDQLLKLASIVDSGGMAKYLITEGYVSINRELVNQRGKKVYKGDLVEVYIPEEEVRTRIKVE